MKRHKFITLLVFCFFSLSCCAQNQNPGKTQILKNEISAKKIAEILSFFPNDEPGGTFLVTQNGKHIASAALGKSNLEIDEDIKLDNIFNIASVTKPFTAVAIFTLIEKGKISLEDKVSKVVPNFPKEGKDITIGHLLSHSSGMEYKNDEEQRLKFKKAIKNKKENDASFIVEYFTEEKFDAKPGDKHDYNNASYQLLGYIIEQVSGKNYEEYLQEVFFTPLNMASTFLESDTKVIKNRAIGYDSFNGNQYQIKNTNSDDSYYYSAGGLMSTVEDLSIWYEALMNYKIISKTSLEKLIAPIKYNDGTYAGNGYGVFAGNLNGHNYILHDGLTYGYGSIVLYFPESKMFIAHLRNCGYCKYDKDLSYQAPIKIASTILNSEFKDTNGIDLEIFEGIYTSKFTKDKVIIKEGNKLYMVRNSDYVPLKFIGNNTFFNQRGNETLIFAKNELTLLNGVDISLNKEKRKPKKSLSLYLENIVTDIEKEDLTLKALNKLKDKNYTASESKLNSLGYSLMQQRKLDLAIEIFKLNVYLFPDSANAFDSLGEAYFYDDNFDKSFENYKESLKLNPKSKNAQLMLQKIKTKNN